MSDLLSLIADIQREVGVKVDRKFGPVTASNVLAALRARNMDLQEEKEAPATVSECTIFDDRTEANLATLDPKAIPMARQFLCLAKATAATLGCDVIVISGDRTFTEQDALYAQGRTKPGNIVTKARGGYSNHNFKIAFDVGIFLGKIYLDGGTKEQQIRASKVHKAISENAAECGLEWGGSWTSIVDQPHYQVITGMTTAAMRKRFIEKGSVL
jgi:peptidoglycan LD-endopeptidase CwlK